MEAFAVMVAGFVIDRIGMGRFLFCGFDLKTNNNDQRINDN